VRQIVAALVDEVGLPRTVLGKKPVELSGGMRKRAGLARALALDPHVVLYDEPTTGLDPIMSDVINELILRVRSRPRVTSVVVTHDMHTARKVGDRIVMLYPLFRVGEQEPQIVFDGTPADLNASQDPRIRQFVEGRAGARLTELQEEQGLGAGHAGDEEDAS
jgi:phospholipid/cholesterol/gamma-HCH transport system ATP-binding protein